MGDTYFSEAYPFFDLSSGGDFLGMIDAVAVVLAGSDGDTKIMPGHGKLASRADLEEYHAMLVALRDRVQSGIDDGLTVNAMLEAKITQDLDEKWSSGFMGPAFVVQNVYNSLTR